MLLDREFIPWRMWIVLEILRLHSQSLRLSLFPCTTRTPNPPYPIPHTYHLFKNFCLSFVTKTFTSGNFIWEAIIAKTPKPTTADIDSCNN